MMQRFRINTAVALALVVSAGACSDRPYPTADARDEAGAVPQAAKTRVKQGGLVLPVEGALSDGGSFKGTATITRFEIDETTRVLYAVGTLDGVAKPNDDHAYHIKDQAFRTSAGLARANQTAAAAAPADATNMYRQVQGVCDILLLDLGPLHLDLLGLTVDLNEVILDVNAVAGGGNLLGNLLCGLLGLLDVVAIIAEIQAVLDAINNLLAGLGGAAGAVGFAHPAPTATLGFAAT